MRFNPRSKFIWFLAWFLSPWKLPGINSLDHIAIRVDEIAVLKNPFFSVQVK
jgi:hypothetical protein